MADRVVKSVEIREEGAQRVYDRLTNVTRAAQQMSTAVDGASAAVEQSGRKATDSARAFDRYSERTVTNSRAMREYARDLKTVSDAHATGQLSAGQFASEIRRIQQSLQSFKVTGIVDQSALNGLLGIRASMDDIGTSARESAKIFEQSFREAAAFGQQVRDSFNFDHAKRSARDAADAFEELFRNQQKVGQAFRQDLNERLGLDRVARSAQEAAASFNEMFANQERIGRQFQAGIDDRLGIGAAPGKSAADSAQVFNTDFARQAAEAEREAAAFEARLARIIAEIDPLTAAQDRLNVELAEYAALAQKGYLTQQQLAQAQQVAAQRYEYTARSLAGVGSATKLGAQELQILQYQLNDIGVSLASGQNPFTVMLQQGAQITQLFGPGASVQGALKSVGAGVISFITNPLNLAVLAAAALAGGIYYMATSARRNLQPIDDVLEKQEKRIKDIADAYGVAARSAEDYGRSSKSALEFQARQGLGRDSTRYLFEAAGVANKIAPEAFTPDLNGGGVYQYVARFRELQPIVDQFRQSLDARGLQDDLAKLGSATPNRELRAFIETLQDSVGILVKLQGGIRETQTVLDGMARTSKIAQQELVKLRDEQEHMLPKKTTDYEDLVRNYQRQMSAISRLNPATNSPSAISGMGERAWEELQRGVQELSRSTRESLADVQGQLNEFDLSPLQRQLSEATRDYDRRLADYKRTVGDVVGLQALQAEKEAALTLITKEAARAEEARRAGWQLDIRSIGVRSAALQAEIAAERTRISLRAEGYGSEEVERRASESRELSLAQSAYAQSESLRRRVEAEQDAAGALQLQIDVLGKTAGEAARLTTSYQLLDQAKKAAYEEGRDLGEDEIARIKRHAAVVGELTDALAAQKLAQDATFERQQLFMSDGEARIATTLRSAGVDPSSAFGVQYAAYQRASDRLKEYRDLNREVWTGIGQDIANGTKPLDAVGNALQRLAGELTDKAISEGADALFSAVFGGADNPLSAVLGKSSALGSTEQSAMWVRMAGGAGVLSDLIGDAPVGAVQRGGALGAVNALAANDNVGLVPVDEMTAYIRQAAIARDIDPDIALRVARSEGLGAGIWQSNYMRGGYREPSYGPFQLLMGGPGTGFGTGLGNSFMRSSGLNPSDPRNAYAGVDYALNHAATNGWGAWYGAGKAGIGDWQGLSGAHTVAVGQMQQAASQLGTTSTQLASSASGFTDDFGQITGSINAGIGQVADQFVPGFGGILTKLLNGMQQPGGGGLLGSLFGGGGGGISSSTAAAIAGGAAGLFDGGGYTGAGGRYAPAGIVHRGEIVWSQDDIARAGGVGAVEGMRLGLRGYADGGYVPRIPDYARMQRPANAGNGGNVSVQVIDQRGSQAAPVETRETTDASGNRKIEVMVRDIARDEMTTPGRRGNRTLRSNFGVTPQVVRR
ncbi:phage tail length tape measure family protein [Mangrovibrevibacter kandeliae]|uniref:phage tail length tape measure family protein n=1 Tax=Mangrovibrevibacter kandeliae TaxID=2968473 RepID=UPI002117F979|nr:phage tail length tape measure family protein [Aurantimonas sp. CSK15Z-1]MCQ8781725.1 phage tail length tape measure family protein [Aurantimonas sp. CSK15Z-1]